MLYSVKDPSGYQVEKFKLIISSDGEHIMIDPNSISYCTSPLGGCAFYSYEAVKAFITLTNPFKFTECGFMCIMEPSNMVSDVVIQLLETLHNKE